MTRICATGCCRDHELEAVSSHEEKAEMGVVCSYHFIHHLDRRVPHYHMRKCYDSAPEGLWAPTTYMNYSGIFKSLFTVMWDEDEKCFRPFPDSEFLMGDQAGKFKPT